MTFRIMCVVLISGWSVGVFHSAVQAQGAGAQAAGAPGAKSVWDGVFTEEQAKRGEAAYTQNCSECHQADLTGDGFAPALSGADFTNNWNGLTVGDLFERVRISMPPGKENAIPAATKADIVTHILKFNKFPAGTTEMPAQTEALKQFKFEVKP